MTRTKPVFGYFNSHLCFFVLLYIEENELATLGRKYTPETIENGISNPNQTNRIFNGLVTFQEQFSHYFAITKILRMITPDNPDCILFCSQ